MKYIRYGINDIVLSEAENNKLGSKFCVIITDKNGDILTESELYWVADEDAHGNEIEEKKGDKGISENKKQE